MYPIYLTEYGVVTGMIKRVLWNTIYERQWKMFFSITVGSFSSEPQGGIIMLYHTFDVTNATVCKFNHFFLKYKVNNLKKCFVYIIYLLY